MKVDFSKFKNILPYASEIFGVYQPLLGWKSTRIQLRIAKGFMNDKNSFLELILKRFHSNYSVTFGGNCDANVRHILPGTIQSVPKMEFIDYNKVNRKYLINMNVFEMVNVKRQGTIRS